MSNKTQNNMDTMSQKKKAKLEAKREEMERRKAEHVKEKIEEAMRRKMMKNPTLHPGFDYPMSHKTTHILEVSK